MEKLPARMCIDFIGKGKKENKKKRGLQFSKSMKVCKANT